MADPVRLQLTTEILVPPSTAEVGQTIVVEEIDASGRPTKWKAVPLGEGGKGDPGVGIQSVTFKEALPSGWVYTILLTNGQTYDFVAPAGPGGDPGDPITVTDWSADDDYTTVVFSDGSVIQIQAGVGIRNIRASGTDKYGGNVYDVELTNGMGYEITAPAGADGVGIKRIKLSEETAAGNTYTVYLTDGSYYDITAPAGPAGKNADETAMSKVLLTDQTTGDVYRVYVDKGKLMMESEG